MTRVDVLVACGAALGESPLWHAGEQALYWVDIKSRRLYRRGWASGAVTYTDTSEMIGSYAFCANGDQLWALETQLVRRSPDGTLTTLHTLTGARHPAGFRTNEGKCDRAGRFWVGTMHDERREPTGSVYRLDADGTLTHIFNDVIVPNGYVWSLDNRWLYYSDTRRHVIRRYPYDHASGTLGEPTVFVDLSATETKPDGATLDADGCLWSAEFGAGRVVRYTPDGRQDRVLTLPTSSVTSVAFAGDALDTLVITTARHRLSTDELAAQPHAGDVFAAYVGVRGVPEPSYAG